MIEGAAPVIKGYWKHIPARCTNTGTELPELSHSRRVVPKAHLNGMYTAHRFGP